MIQCMGYSRLILKLKRIPLSLTEKEYKLSRKKTLVSFLGRISAWILFLSLPGFSEIDLRHLNIWMLGQKK